MEQEMWQFCLERTIFVCFFMPNLKVCTALSANPLDDGWQGAVLKWQIQIWLYLANSAKSWLVKQELLSVTITFGTLNLANIERKCSMIFWVDDALTVSTSIHLERASTTSRNILPINGPAKWTQSTPRGVWAILKDALEQQGVKVDSLIIRTSSFGLLYRINIWPPNVTACQCFYLWDSRVTIM